VYYRNTLPEVKKHQGVKKARASPKLAGFEKFSWDDDS
jgi:hypothetical protein